jgi:hypothetical protein
MRQKSDISTYVSYIENNQVKSKKRFELACIIFRLKIKHTHTDWDLINMDSSIIVLGRIFCVCGNNQVKNEKMT